MTILLTLFLITLKVLFAFAASIFFVWVMIQLDKDMGGDK
jgi:hypothetical protein